MICGHEWEKQEEEGVYGDILSPCDCDIHSLTNEQQLKRIKKATNWFMCQETQITTNTRHVLYRCWGKKEMETLSLSVTPGCNAGWCSSKIEIIAQWSNLEESHSHAFPVTVSHCCCCCCTNWKILEEQTKWQEETEKENFAAAAAIWRIDLCKQFMYSEFITAYSAHKSQPQQQQQIELYLLQCQWQPYAATPLTSP